MTYIFGSIKLLFFFLVATTLWHNSEGCSDRLPIQYCSSYKVFCDSAGFKDYLAVNCPLTCNRCKKGQTTTSQPIRTTRRTNTILQEPGRKNVESCGSTKPGYTKIIGGRNTKPGNSPWQVVLNRENYSKGRFCGGVLISQEFVLTAAHCFDNQRNFSKYEVIVGVHDLNTVNRWQQSFKIQHVFIHPKYSQSGVDYDSALIQIKGKVRYNDRVRAACLPDETMNFDAGTMCTISGWGNVKEKESGPAIMQTAQVPLVNRKICNTTFHQKHKYTVTSRMLCTAHQNGTIGPCDGDSGSPLVCKAVSPDSGEEIWYVWGTISWGLGCARKGLYSVHANVKYFLSWINSTVFPKKRSVLTT